MTSRDSRSAQECQYSLPPDKHAAAAFDKALNDGLSSSSGQESTLLLANGREVSARLLIPVLQHIVQERKLRRIGRGLEYRVYTSPELEGAVFKLASKTGASHPLTMHPHHLKPAEAAAVADDLIRNGYAVPFIRVPLTIPVQSVRTGKVREQSVELIVQREVLAVDRYWKSNRKDSLRISELGQDLAAFHKHLITAGYLDTDLNCIKNVGYDSLSQTPQTLKLIDLGFVYRLPTDPIGRTSAFASYGDSTHTTLGEFLVGSIFDRFYTKALNDKRIKQVFITLVRELFPGLSTSEMNNVRQTYSSINSEIRSIPRDERMKAYLGRLRSPENAEQINAVLSKLCR